LWKITRAHSISSSYFLESASLLRDREKEAIREGEGGNRKESKKNRIAEDVWLDNMIVEEGLSIHCKYITIKKVDSNKKCRLKYKHIKL
jgi:hypothetical protein